MEEREDQIGTMTQPGKSPIGSSLTMLAKFLGVFLVPGPVLALRSPVGRDPTRCSSRGNEERQAGATSMIQTRSLAFPPRFTPDRSTRAWTSVDGTPYESTGSGGDSEGR